MSNFTVFFDFQRNSLDFKSNLFGPNKKSRKLLPAV
nr:MAG TPA: hypothetical protein [Caudoviricetes sp.]